MPTLQDYLNTSYSPDCEFVDGVIVERNLGMRPHSTIQGNLIVYLGARHKQLGIRVYPSVRVQVAPTRVRVPDLAAVKLPEPDGEIVTTPPYVCIEVLSPEDTMQDMLDKLDDYLNFGVPYVWFINPGIRKAFVATSAGMVEARPGFLETDEPAITVPLTAVFDEV